MAPTLSALLIVKNEQDRLPRCLRSLEGVVDELVVVDTGSTDDTVTIARSFGALMGHASWTDDFSAARNASLRFPTGDWILWIDADEWLEPVDRVRLVDELADDRTFGRLVSLSSRRTTVRYRELRLFRRHPDLLFRGVVHADLTESVTAILEGSGLRIEHSHLRIEHDGYDGDQEPKHEQRLPMLEVRAASDPDHVLTWLDLGRILARRGDAEGGIDAYLSGLAAARRTQTRRASDVLIYCVLGYAARGGVLRESVDLDASALLHEGLARFGPVPGLRFLQAQLAIDAGRPDEAIDVLEALVAVDLDTYVDPGVAWDRRLFGEWAWAMLGSCRFAREEYEQAARAYAEAARHNPTAEYRAKAAVARHRADRQMTDGMH